MTQAKEKEGNGKKPELAVEKKNLSLSEKFSQKVIAEYGTSVGEIELSRFQQRLVGNYFIAIDIELNKAEKKRINNFNSLPYSWDNLERSSVIRSVIAAARIGLDPMQKNHVSPVFYKNKKTNKYDMSLTDGYRGLELKAVKYGLDVPDAVTVELVYSKDKFKAIKKDRDHEVESYEFEVVSTFDRGEVVGGFYYHAWKDAPAKNKLRVFTLKEIMKRKPPKAAAEFWGGEKDVWENGEKTGKKEHVEGWTEQMQYKTVARAAYNDITIDSSKIDEDYLRLVEMENNYKVYAADREADENANKGELIDVDYTVEGEPAEIEAPQPPDHPYPGKGKLTAEPVEQGTLIGEGPGF